MNADASRAELVRQLAAQGWTDTAIADATHMSVEQVALALGTGGSEPESAACHQAPSRPPPLRAHDSKVDGNGSADMAERPQRRPMAAEDFGRATFERLAKQRAQLQAAGALLRAEIERLAITDRASGNRKRGRALRIQRQLARPVALRTVQWHLAAITQKGSPARE